MARALAAARLATALTVPPRDWLDDLLAARSELELTELQLLDEDPEKAAALADLLGGEQEGGEVQLGASLVRFLPGCPPGRPQLHAELFT